MLDLACVFLINIGFIRARHFFLGGGQRSCMFFGQIEVCGMGQVCHQFLEFLAVGLPKKLAVWAVVLATHQMHVC